MDKQVDWAKESIEQGEYLRKQQTLCPPPIPTPVYPSEMENNLPRIMRQSGVWGMDFGVRQTLVQAPSQVWHLCGVQ